MAKKVCVVAADGCEETELVAPVDVLRRGGVEVRVLALSGKDWVEGSHGIKIAADGAWDVREAMEADLFVVPGGMRGVERLLGDETVLRIVRERHAAGKWVAAICAGPMVLAKAGALDGARFTCHPSVKGRLNGALEDNPETATDPERRVATGRGAGTAVPFGLSLLAVLEGGDKAREVAAGMAIPS